MNIFCDENGQGMVEYALIIGLVALVLVAAIILLNDRVANSINKSADKVNIIE